MAYHSKKGVHLPVCLLKRQRIRIGLFTLAQEASSLDYQTYHVSGSPRKSYLLWSKCARLLAGVKDEESDQPLAQPHWGHKRLIRPKEGAQLLVGRLSDVQNEGLSFYQSRQLGEISGCIAPGGDDIVKTMLLCRCVAYGPYHLHRQAFGVYR